MTLLIGLVVCMQLQINNTGFDKSSPCDQVSRFKAPMHNSIRVNLVYGALLEMNSHFCVSLLQFLIFNIYCEITFFFFKKFSEKSLGRKMNAKV